MKRLNLAGLAAIAEVIGTVGIIASLIFVAVGISSNTAEVRASQINSIYDESRQIEMSVASDPEWVDIVLRGRNQTAQLSEIEQWRYDAYVVATLDLWDQLSARAEDGLMDDDEIEGWDTYFERWVQQYVRDSQWQRLKWQYVGPVLAKVDAAILSDPLM